MTKSNTLQRPSNLGIAITPSLVARSLLVIASLALAAACGSVGEDAESDDGVDAAESTDLESCDTAAAGEPCMDSWGAKLCPTDTGYPGDDLALCDPPEGEGFLFRYGPDNYDDPEEVAKYLLPAGSEDEMCVYIRTQNEETVYLSDFHGRMRPGSHHLIVTLTEDTGDIVYDTPVECTQGGAIGDRWLVGSQDPQLDVAAGGSERGAPSQPGDPEYGGAIRLPANSILRLDLHYLNPTDEEILREAWVYLKRKPAEEVEVEVELLGFYQSSIDVPPQSTGVSTPIGRCRVPSDRYLGIVTGHFHENGTRFTVWHEPQGEQPVKIYETSNWEDPGNAAYSARVENPSLDDIGIGTDWGATEGYIELKEGDYVNFQCEFDNPTDEPVGLGDQGRDQMCNVFGMYFPSDGDTWDCECLGAFCVGGLDL